MGSLGCASCPLDGGEPSYTHPGPREGTDTEPVTIKQTEACQPRRRNKDQTSLAKVTRENEKITAIVLLKKVTTNKV